MFVLFMIGLGKINPHQGCPNFTDLCTLFCLLITGTRKIPPKNCTDTPEMSWWMKHGHFLSPLHGQILQTRAPHFCNLTFMVNDAASFKFAPDWLSTFKIYTVHAWISLRSLWITVTTALETWLMLVSMQWHHDKPSLGYIHIWQYLQRWNDQKTHMSIWANELQYPGGCYVERC